VLPDKGDAGRKSLIEGGQAEELVRDVIVSSEVVNKNISVPTPSSRITMDRRLLKIVFHCARIFCTT
jgi:hypothetical protein